MPSFRPGPWGLLSHRGGNLRLLRGWPRGASGGPGSKAGALSLPLPVLAAGRVSPFGPPLPACEMKAQMSAAPHCKQAELRVQRALLWTPGPLTGLVPRGRTGVRSPGREPGCGSRGVAGLPSREQSLQVTPTSPPRTPGRGWFIPSHPHWPSPPVPSSLCSVRALSGLGFAGDMEENRLPPVQGSSGGDG